MSDGIRTKKNCMMVRDRHDDAAECVAAIAVTHFHPAHTKPVVVTSAGAAA
jgi:hypothetical protein